MWTTTSRKRISRERGSHRHPRPLAQAVAQMILGYLLIVVGLAPLVYGYHWLWTHDRTGRTPWPCPLIAFFALVLIFFGLGMVMAR